MEPAFLQSSALRVESLPQRGRKLRRPTHNFAVKYRPFVIQPFMLAPVLPGDTLKNLLLQAKVVTDPIKSSMLGWHNEFYFFYVKLRDLSDRAALEAMLMTNSAPPAASPALAMNYSNGEGVDYTAKCLARVVETYFRSEEENATGSSPAWNSQAIAKLTSVPGWMENLKADSDAPASDGTALPGDMFPVIPDQYVGTQFEAAYTQWKQMQSLELVPPTFESYLKTFGITPPRTAKEDPHLPELIRYVRNWKQPSNTVGETGAMNSQVVWDVAERADKDRFFAEPGFIFGVTTCRAKMYSGTQVSAMGHFLNDAYAWLPALLAPDPFTSLKKFAFAGAGPLANQTEDYWVDLADLFVSGDQFITDITDAAFGVVDRPFETGGPIDIQVGYPSQTGVDGLFVNAAGGKNLIRSEGRCDLTILSAVQDTTP